MGRSIKAKERSNGSVYLASLLLFVSAIMLTAYSTKNPESARVGAMIFDAILSPAQNINQNVQGSVSSLWSSYIDLVGANEERLRLDQEVKRLIGENTQLKERLIDDQKLRALLGVLENSKLKGVAARVIGHEPSNWVKAVIVDQGSSAGIEDQMAVVDTSGLVGQIISVGRSSARVLLLTDHSSGVDAVVQDTRVRLVVEGLGGAVLRGNYVSPEDKVQVGENVVTSGMDGVFPAGVLIGTITGVERDAGGLFQVLSLRPAVDFAKLEQLLIIKDRRGKDG